MSEVFYSFVRGVNNELPVGFTKKGMEVYRFLTFLGVSQLIESNYPKMRSELGEDAWQYLIKDFIVQSRWTSNFYGDLNVEFLEYLHRKTQ